MSFLPAEYLPYVKYATPPLVGAFIGYLTNRVAIRMLFRPLKEWRFFGVRVPMTPGVIPSKRHQLADNMGEVVGDHLLTSKEIGNALKEDKFQQHLLNVIAERVGAILHKDLPSVKELVPEKYEMYFNLTQSTVKQQLRENVHQYVHSDDFTHQIEHGVEVKLEQFLVRPVGELMGADERETAYAFVESALGKMLDSPVMAKWVDDFVKSKVYDALQNQKSLQDVLPESLMQLLETSIRDQTPALLTRLAGILKDQEVRDGIVRGACGGVESFIISLGPMAPMVQNFISMEMVDEKIREYLDEKEEDIIKYLSSEELQEKVAVILSERFAGFAAKPIVEIVSTDDAAKVEDFCTRLAEKITLLLQGSEVKEALTGMLRGNIEGHLEKGDVTVQTVLRNLTGDTGVTAAKSWVKSETLKLLRSPDTLKTLDAMLYGMVDTLVNKRIGKLSNFLPAGVRKEIYVSIQKMASTMLEQEVPGLVDSLDIRTIIADKLNSLDLLRLERLLLSIMEEQFKYINLFGALLGFLIGCCNVVLLSLS